MSGFFCHYKCLIQGPL